VWLKRNIIEVTFSSSGDRAKDSLFAEIVRQQVPKEGDGWTCLGQRSDHVWLIHRSGPQFLPQMLDFVEQGQVEIFPTTPDGMYKLRQEALCFKLSALARECEKRFAVCARCSVPYLEHLEHKRECKGDRKHAREWAELWETPEEAAQRQAHGAAEPEVARSPPPLRFGEDVAEFKVIIVNNHYC
jgi:hypothetical protein